MKIDRPWSAMRVCRLCKDGNKQKCETLLFTENDRLVYAWLCKKHMDRKLVNLEALLK